MLAMARANAVAHDQTCKIPTGERVSGDAADASWYSNPLPMVTLATARYTPWLYARTESRIAAIAIA